MLHEVNVGLDIHPWPRSSVENMNYELAQLAIAYNKDMSEFREQIANIALADGPTEASKISAIRARHSTRKSQYNSDVSAIRAKYQGA